MKTRLFSLMTVLMLLLSSCGRATEQAPTWQKQYDLGLRYLSEGNYEEAIIAFTAAIEIDPKQELAYLSLADVYTAMGDTEKASEILAQALEYVGETEALAAALEKLSALDNPLSNMEEPIVSSPWTERTNFEDGSYSITEYDAYGSLVRSMYYNADGSLDSYFTCEFDDNGYIIREIHYAADGSLSFYVIPEWDDMGSIVCETHYNADGVLELVREYDTDGSIMRDTYYNAHDGTIDFIYEP